MLNELLLALARWLDTHAWSTALHESYYMYAWIETTHVLTIMVFLGMLFIIDLRMLGLAFTSVPASRVAARLDKPMMIGFAVMIATGVTLYYAIPVRTTQSIWFRIKVVLLIAAGVNAWLFRRRMQASVGTWDMDPKPPQPIRWGAGASLLLWAGVVMTGRAIAYDWFDCHKQQSTFVYWAAGCVDELAALGESVGEGS
ncbi:MAG: hypothetical protein CMD83_17565 [Gammaproteobacteria bacterium]|nr:hypothetical protein [Gammaproteobacteria bacterium]MBS05082.1 hypothetical protein [Gammaproteobacteria bacterium]|tara:strand:+ start:2784 stop:3380 length:597 start_codon:yes stop_codon:yes gene_type:complete